MTTNATEKKVQILVGSSHESFHQIVERILYGFHPYELHKFLSVDSILEATTSNFFPALALIDGHEGTNKANEWVQSTKMTHPQTKIIVLHSGRDLLDFAQIKKNGADEIMHINYDREFIADMVLALAPVDMEGDIPVAALLSVDTRDILEDTELNFDLFIHLPSNHKTIKYRHEGAKVEKKNLEKFENARQNMYIKKTQTKKFFEYARTMASLKNMDNPVSITEKLDKSKRHIYAIMSEFMNATASDYQEGRKILEKCKEVLQEFDFIKDIPAADIGKETFRFTGHPRSYYNDAINMAALCALFAQALDWPVERREHAALAGLLHNIGLALIPESCVGKEPTEMTTEELHEYHLYPDRSVLMVKGKKVPLHQEVSDGILMHRERGDGKGFPKALTSDKITELGRLTATAFRFLEITSLQNNATAKTPDAALKEFKDLALGGDPQFDIVMMTKLSKRLLNGR